MADAAKTEANADQWEYWNAGQGQKWVANQATIDRHLGNLTEFLFAGAAIAPGETVIDIGAGSGETTIRVATLVGEQGAVLGVDISEPMQALARERCAAAGVANVRLILADAQTHDFAGGEFDLALSRFGVMFFDDPTAAFRNIREALKPDGRLCFICWAPLEVNPWFKVPLDAATRRLGPPEPQPPRTPGPFAYSDPAYVTEILNAAGFADIAIDRQELLLAGPKTLEAATEFACIMGPATRLIAAREPDDATIAAISAEIMETFGPYLGADGVQVPSTVYCVRAAKAA
jgi:SAM-dependent methyltransferase